MPWEDVSAFGLLKTLKEICHAYLFDNSSIPKNIKLGRPSKYGNLRDTASSLTGAFRDKTLEYTGHFYGKAE